MFSTVGSNHTCFSVLFSPEIPDTVLVSQAFLSAVFIKLSQLPFLTLICLHVLPLSEKLTGSWEGGEIEICLYLLEERMNGRTNVALSSHLTDSWGA